MKIFKRLTSLLVVLCMLISLVPNTALADDEVMEGPDDTSSVEITNGSPDLIICNLGEYISPGETITVTPRKGIKLTSVSFNGEELTGLDNGNYQFQADEHGTVYAEGDIDLEKIEIDGSDVYSIGSAADMKTLSDAVNDGYSTLNKKFKVNTEKLTDNTIDLTNCDFAPIGTYAAPFAGSFDGSGAVFDLNINCSENLPVGLFGVVDDENSGAVIQNIITSGSVKSSVSNQNKIINAGGIVGSCKGAVKIVNCENRADIENPFDSTGGIVGSIWVGTENDDCPEIYSCINRGAVKNTNKENTSADSGVGGIAGYSGETKIANCYNAGAVSFTNGKYSVHKKTGGIVGITNKSVINCVNTGEISETTGLENLAFGAVVGRYYAGVEISGCYYSNSGIFGISNKSGDMLTADDETKTKHVADLPTEINDTVGSSVYHSLNMYVYDNISSNPYLRYWKSDKTQISFMSEDEGTPELSFECSTNSHSNCAGFIEIEELENNVVKASADLPEGVNIDEWSVKTVRGADVEYETAADGSITFTMTSDVIVDIIPKLDFEKDADGNYLIKSAADMVKLSEIVKNNYLCYNESFKAAAEEDVIDITDCGFEPIGMYAYREFCGNFDGNNKTFKVDIDIDRDCVGLFGAVGASMCEDCVIKNVIVSGSVKSSGWNVGGVAGLVQSGADGKTSVINCRNTAEIQGGDRVGGIAGSLKGEIYGCANSGNITVTADAAPKAGGIVGLGDTDKNASGVANCYNSGTVKATSTAENLDKNNVGAIAGSVYTILSCASDGKAVDSDGNRIGGQAAGTVAGEFDGVFYKYDGAAGEVGIKNTGTQEMTAEDEAAMHIAGGIKTMDDLLVLNAKAYEYRSAGISAEKMKYWSISEDGAVVFTDTLQNGAYTIVNKSETIISAPNYIYSGETVTVTPVSAGLSKNERVSNVKVTNVRGGTEQNATRNADGTFSFVMPEHFVIISAETDIDFDRDADGNYLIKSAADMVKLSEIVKDGEDCSGKNFKAVGEEDVIDLTDCGFEPIGNYSADSKYFNGNFDGSNKTFKVNLNGDSKVGLFALVGKNTDTVNVIKNVIVSGSVKGNSEVGAVVGQGTGVHILNCRNTAVVSSKGRNRIGGIIGYILVGKVVNCINTGEVHCLLSVAGQGQGGGIVGTTAGATDITNCYNAGDVIVDISDGENIEIGIQYTVGGIIGYADVQNVSIKNCANSAEVKTSAGAKDIGGMIAGCADSGTVMVGNYYQADKASSTQFGVGKMSGKSGNTVMTQDADGCAHVLNVLDTDTVNALNTYVYENSTDTTLRYWYVSEDGAVSMSSVRPAMKFKIDNSAENLAVTVSSAVEKSEVEITLKDIPSYINADSIIVSVDGVQINKNENGKYVFVMPAKNVKLDVKYEMNLTKTSDDRYVISSKEDFAVFAAGVNSGMFANASAELAADIALSTEDGFTPVGTADAPYGGYFHGMGHTINVDISNTAESAVTGLFGYTKHAYIYDLILKGKVTGGTNGDAEDKYSCTGALIGICRSAGVYNVFVQADVEGSGYVGGIAGKIDGEGTELSDEYLTISNVVYNGAIAQNAQYAGTVAGDGTVRYSGNFHVRATGGAAGSVGADGTEGPESAYYIAYTDTADLYSDATTDELNSYVLFGNSDYWWNTAEDADGNSTFVMSQTDSTMLSPIDTDGTALSDMLIADMPSYARAGATVKVRLDKDYEFSADTMVDGVNGIIVKDTRGNVIESKCADKVNMVYEFTMPARGVKVGVAAEYTLMRGDNGEYYISDEDDFNIFLEILRSGNTDIDAKIVSKQLDLTSFVPTDDALEVCLFGGHYNGTFDGNGALIKTNYPLFKYVQNAVIKNVNIELDHTEADGWIRDGHEFMSGLCYSAFNAVIDNCNVAATFNDKNVGGIALVAEESVITNCSVDLQYSNAGWLGGIALVSGDCLIANCMVFSDSMLVVYYMGGIVGRCTDYGTTKIYNCASFMCNGGYTGAIAMIADDSNIELENNFYCKLQNFGADIDVLCDDEGYCRDEDIDPDSKMTADDFKKGYVAAAMNRYIDENPDLADGITLKKWSVNTDSEKNTDNILVFADDEYTEVYGLEFVGDVSYWKNVSTGVAEAAGAKEGDVIELYNVSEDVVLNVTAANGKTVELKASDGNNAGEKNYEFVMPDSSVTVTVMHDCGIDDMITVDGTTYAVVKTADDLINAVNSVALGNTQLNLYIANDITVSEEKAAQGSFDTARYSGILEGNGHTVNFEKLSPDNGNVSLFDAIGEKGVVRNLIIDGIISSSNFSAAGIAIDNYGIIANCINKADISASSYAGGLVATNWGIAVNCVNKGAVSGGRNAALIVVNEGFAHCLYNEVSSASKEIILNGSVATSSLLYDLSEEGLTDEDILLSIAEGNSMVKYRQSCSDTKKYYPYASAWSYNDGIVFADAENVPYFKYYDASAKKDRAVKVGETVSTTVSDAMMGEGVEITEVYLADKYADERMDTEVVQGENDTYTFVMPEAYCTLDCDVVSTGMKADDDGYYIVENIDDLLKVKDVIENLNKSINVRLEADIDESLEETIDADGYNGIFDGNGHYITLDISEGVGEDYNNAGLFAEIGANGVVKDLTIKGKIYANAAHAGAVAGVSRGTIINCVNYADIDILSDDTTFAGGIVGFLKPSLNGKKASLAEIMPSEGDIKYSAVVSGCKNYGSVKSYSSGGIIGCVNYDNAENAKFMIRDCENNAEVVGSGESPNAFSAGGIVCGSGNYVKNNKMVISGCVNNGLVDGKQKEAGGIISYATYADIYDCVNNGKVTGGSGGVGGIAGSALESRITNCLSAGEVYTSYGEGGGIVGVSLDKGNVKVENCYFGANITDNTNTIMMYHNALNESSIENSYCLQENGINSGMETSNMDESMDKTQKVTSAQVASGLIAAKLNSGISGDMKCWTVKDGALALTDDKSEGYYEIAVDEKLADGTVAADKAFAKAGETVTLTVNSTETKKTMIILGVELAEDNSFVMPENKVIISAQIGDGFKATEKEDVIHLAENVKADDIALADFVEFENEELTREFAFALAEGSTLPDGLKLSYGRIVGTPTKAGTYTVVFDVTDPSAAALMSLDKEVAIGTAQLTLTIEVEKTYKVEVENSENGSVTADKEYAKAGEKIALTVAADSGYALESLTGAEFDENNGFVMPESDVKIKAVFAPIFTGTDKDDTVALVQNFAMTPINLGDYVKFADDKVNGTFAFAVAEESALPDGLKLENGTVSGTPTVSGNYKVKFKVTQSAAQLMSLTPEFAVSSAVLELTFDITATYKVNISEIKNGSVTADKEYAKAGESVKLTVTPDEGYTLVGITGVSVDAEKTFVMPAKDVTVGALFKGEDAQITEPVIISELGSDGKYIVKYMVPENMDYCLICAVYNADGTLKSVRTVKAKDDQNNGELTIAAGENTKVMLWKDLESVKPLCNSCELN